MQVPVTLHDILAAVSANNQPVAETFRQNYCLGLTTVGSHESIFRVTLKVQKPCPWLQDELCSIYPTRPLACMLFPESHILAATSQLLAQQWDFSDYACFRTELAISRERAGVIRALRGLLQKELLVSESYLFGSSPFLVDLPTLVTDLCPHGEMAENPSVHSAANGVQVSLVDIDAAFRKRFFRCSPFAELEEKWVELEDLGVRARLFALLENKRALQQLQDRCDGSQHVFRLDGGVLKRKRVSLIPPECSFM
jgi:Fe-S-cluster containining protein